MRDGASPPAEAGARLRRGDERGGVPGAPGSGLGGRAAPARRGAAAAALQQPGVAEGALLARAAKEACLPQGPAQALRPIPLRAERRRA